MSNEWTTAEHALAYLRRADRIPHRTEGEATLLAEVPKDAGRILDLGAGDGRLLGLLLLACPTASGVAVEFSPPMLERLRQRFSQDGRVKVVEHDLEHPLPPLAAFDVVGSSFAIHHLPHLRKEALYREVWGLLGPGGVFCNLEHVASPSARLHERFLAAVDIAPGQEDPSNKLLDVETQLRWLREIGFEDVDCYWKWRELALLVGRRPAGLRPENLSRGSGHGRQC
jgi:SAM-dependent methyltransferase